MCSHLVWYLWPWPPFCWLLSLALCFYASSIDCPSSHSGVLMKDPECDSPDATQTRLWEAGLGIVSNLILFGSLLSSTNPFSTFLSLPRREIMHFLIIHPWLWTVTLFFYNRNNYSTKMKRSFASYPSLSTRKTTRSSVFTLHLKRCKDQLPATGLNHRQLAALFEAPYFFTDSTDNSWASTSY